MSALGKLDERYFGFICIAYESVVTLKKKKGFGGWYSFVRGTKAKPLGVELKALPCSGFILTCF